MTDSDRIEQLERLQHLRDSGMLDDAEFAAEKARILGGEDEIAESVRQRNRLALFLGFVILLPLAAWLGLRLAGWTGGDHGENLVPKDPLAGPSSSAPKAAARDPLLLAFAAATGHRQTFSREGDGGTMIEGPVKLVEMPFGPVLLTESKMEESCHGCAGSVGVYYLRRDGEGYTVTGSWPDAVEGWGWGLPPEWEMTSRFTSQPAIYAEGGFSSTGVSCSGATITELTPQGPVTSPTIGLSYSNGGMEEEGTGKTYMGDPLENLEGKIVNVVKDRSFDVEATGTDSFTEHYEHGAKGYTATQESSRLTC